MFKELKIIKLVVIASFFVYIIQSSFQDLKTLHLFYSDDSVYNTESVNLILAANFTDNQREFELKDLNGNSVNKIVAEVKETFKLNENVDRLSEGYSLDNSKSISFNEDAKSGIYRINDYPIIVKNSQPADVTIVYPQMNNSFYAKTEDGYFFNGKKSHLSLNRGVPIDKHTKGMRNVFSHIEENYSTNYIADLDLENKDDYFESKLLIIYGYSSFWTHKMRENVLDFLHEGGNILLMTSKVMHTKFWLDKQSRIVRTVEEDEFQELKLITWAQKHGESPFVNIGLTDKYGGVAVDIFNSQYTVKDQSHPIFKDVASKSIPIEGKNFMGALIDWEEEVPVPVKLPNLNVQILAYTLCKGSYENSNSGIFLVEQDSIPGKILAFGTEDWCLDKNQQKIEIQTITHNAIEFLLSR